MIINQYLESSELIAISPVLFAVSKNLKEITNLTSKVALIIVGPSGVGKDTIVSKLSPEKFVRIRSATTRPRRPTESEDHYQWLTEASFLQMQNEGQFIEVNTFSGFHYGTVRQNVAQILEDNRIPIFLVDPNGAASLLQLTDDPLLSQITLLYCYIAPPSLEALEERLTSRYGDDQQAIQKRIDTTKHDLPRMSEAHYIIINDNLEQAITAIDQIASQLPGLNSAQPSSDK